MTWPGPVVRIDVPWMHQEIDDSAYDHQDALYGEQVEWGYAIPSVHRALAAPDVPVEIVRPDGRNAVPYWSALLHLLVYSFGWNRPDLGLSHWYFSGRPSEGDARLELMEAIWVGDGRIEEFLAQLIRLEHTWSELSERMKRLRTLGGPAPRGVKESSGRRTAPRDFVDAVIRRIGDVENFGSPLVGGGDPLHFQYHIYGPLRDEGVGPKVRERLVVDERNGRAVMQLDGMLGWYHTLNVVGAELPDRGERSWYVDVHVATVGHLGTFRQSRDSGLWFSGKHRFHLWGVD